MVDEKGSIYVLEADRHRIQVYDKIQDYEEHPLNLGGVSKSVSVDRRGAQDVTPSCCCEGPYTTRTG